MILSGDVVRKLMVFDKNNSVTKEWTIVPNQPCSVYFTETLKDIPVINIPFGEIFIIDCDRKDVFIDSCGAYVETDKGRHFIFSADMSVKDFDSLQDQKYLRYSQLFNNWAQFIQSKVTKEKRVMKINKPEWANFVNKWNTLVTDYLNKHGN